MFCVCFFLNKEMFQLRWVFIAITKAKCKLFMMVNGLDVP